MHNWTFIGSKDAEKMSYRVYCDCGWAGLQRSVHLAQRKRHGLDISRCSPAEAPGTTFKAERVALVAAGDACLWSLDGPCPRETRPTAGQGVTQIYCEEHAAMFETWQIRARRGLRRGR